MISSDERFIIGMKVLERLQNGWRDGRTQINTMLETSARRKKNGHGSPSRSHNDEPDFPPSLEALLAQVGELSPYSVVLGVCEDGLPITLELDNPAPGALLISSEHKGGKTRLLRAVLASAMQLNTPDQVRIHALTPEPKVFQGISSPNHTYEVLGPDTRARSRLIAELYDLAETRRQNRPEDPHVILAIDDLAACLGDLGEEDFRRLLGLMRHGPRSFIWPIVTLSAEDSHLIHPRMLEALRTRLIGFIHDDERAATLSQDESLDARLIHEGIQFYVPYDEGWLPFWICDPIVKRMEGPTPQEQRAEKQASPSQPPVKNEAKELLKSWNERLQTTTAEVREEQRPPRSPLSPSPERIFPETRKLDDDKPALDNPRPWKRPVPKPTDPPENDVPPPAFLENLPATDSGDENRQNADLLETGEINDRNSDLGNAAENRTTEGSAAKDPEPERGLKPAVPDEVVYETEYDYIDEYLETTTQIDQPGDV